MIPASRERVVMLWSAVAASCLLIFAAQFYRAGETWDAIEQRQAVLETRSNTLNSLARELRHQADVSREQAKSKTFIEDLPNLLPEQARFIKTQNIVQEEVEGLRRKIASRLSKDLYIIVDTKASRLYLKQGFKQLLESNASVGRGGTLIDSKTNRRWDFNTPKGIFRILWKAPDPIWIKPDWAFIEAKQPVPPPDSPERMVRGELGAYLLDIGNGYLIHGTKNEESLGRPVSHGCIRLGAEDLQFVYNTVPVGTKVYVY